MEFLNKEKLENQELKNLQDEFIKNSAKMLEELQKRIRYCNKKE